MKEHISIGRYILLAGALIASAILICEVAPNIQLTPYARAQTPAQGSDLIIMSGKFLENTKRDCVAVGDGTNIDSDNSGSNLSAAMNAWTRVVFQCDDVAYFEFGDATATADSNDLQAAAGAILGPFVIDSTNRYLAVLNKNSATADCRFAYCR